MPIDASPWETQQTAVHEAARLGRIDVLVLLLRAYVEHRRRELIEESAWNSQNDQSSPSPTPDQAISIDEEVVPSSDVFVFPPLFIDSVDRGIVRSLLMQRNAAGRTVLLEAAKAGQPATVAFLWAQGADPTAQTNSGSTMLMVL